MMRDTPGPPTAAEVPAADAAAGGLETRVLLGLTAAVDPTTAREALASLRAAGVTLTGTPLAG